MGIELPVQRRLCAIFVKSWVSKKGHSSVGSGYVTSTSLSRVDGLSTDPQVLGRHSLVLELR